MKDLTIFTSLSVSLVLIAMGYLACNGDYKPTCDRNHLPLISQVIIWKQMYNRIFIFLTAILMFGVQQVNIRAFYKILYDKIPD